MLAKADKSRQLTVEQENAIDLLIQGLPDREVAEAVGVSRQTVTTWRNENPVFAAELNRRRQETWGGHKERLVRLIGRAVEVLGEDLDAEDRRLRQTAAIHILRAVGLYGTNLLVTDPTNSEDMENTMLYRVRERERVRRLLRNFP